MNFQWSIRKYGMKSRLRKMNARESPYVQIEEHVFIKEQPADEKRFCIENVYPVVLI